MKNMKGGNAQFEFDARLRLARERIAQLDTQKMIACQQEAVLIEKGLLEGYVVGMACQDPAEDTSRGGPCMTEGDVEAQEGEVN